jgi:hypothetical protein
VSARGGCHCPQQGRTATRVERRGRGRPGRDGPIGPESELEDRGGAWGGAARGARRVIPACKAAAAERVPHVRAVAARERSADGGGGGALRHRAQHVGHVVRRLQLVGKAGGEVPLVG